MMMKLGKSRRSPWRCESVFVLLLILSTATVVRSFAPPPSTKRTVRQSLLFYHQAGDPPVDAWTALAQTERWISETLQNANGNNNNSNNSNGGGGDNPYARKEVSFSAETHNDMALVISSIWKRLHQARLLGEKHGKQQQKLQEEQGEYI